MAEAKISGDLIGSRTIENNARQIIIDPTKPQDEYDEIVKIIGSGGSWMDSQNNSALHSSIETLPSRAEIAARSGNARIIIETSNNIDAQIASLQRQKDFLVNAQGQKLTSESSKSQAQEEEPSVKTFDEIVTEKVGASAATALTEAGYTSVTDIQDANNEELKAVNGIGGVTFDKLREAFPKAA